MARFYNQKYKGPNLKISTKDKFIRGLNTLVSPTQIRDDELAEATDIQLIEDGKVQCPRDGQVYYGNESGNKVFGLFPYYKSNGTKELLRMASTKLQKLNTSTGNWSDISGFTYEADTDTDAVIAQDSLYIANGIDPLTFYDGTNITSYTAIAAPGTPGVARTGGAAGSYTFSYKITAVTSVGETTPSAAGTATLNQATLDNSVFMTVTWSAVTNATGYNVYGRKHDRWYFLTRLEGNGSVSYVDKGQDTPYELMVPPVSNSTEGPTGSIVAVYKTALFMAGDPNNPSRLYYSAGGDRINDWGQDEEGNGGGIIDISKNDGQIITGLKVFKDKLLVFKEDSIYQFDFVVSLEGAPQFTLVTSSIGAISSKSIIIVENDVFFASRRGIFTIGNESGFSFDVLRTNELSARVRSIFQTIEPSKLNKISGVYATKNNVNLCIFSFTPQGSSENTNALIYDRERLAWYYWTNITANCWANFIDSGGEMHVLYGDSLTGYAKEILSGNDDFGSAISGMFRIKAESFGGLAAYKTLKDVDVVFRKPIGSANIAIIKDGTEEAFSVNASTISPTINFGSYIMSDFLLGESYGGGALTQANDIVLRSIKNINIQNGKSYQLEFDNGSSGATFVLLEAKLTAKPKAERFRTSEDLVGATPVFD